MICINNDIILFNSMDLNEFIDILKEQPYNDETQKITDCIIDFLYEVWDRDGKLTELLHKKVDPDVFPVVMVYVDETADLTKVDIEAMCRRDDYKPTKADSLAFNQFCERYFKTLKPLYDRFSELKLD